jgi:hypothetical protein
MRQRKELPGATDSGHGNAGNLRSRDVVHRVHADPPTWQEGHSASGEGHGGLFGGKEPRWCARVYVGCRSNHRPPCRQAGEWRAHPLTSAPRRRGGRDFAPAKSQSHRGAEEQCSGTGRSLQSHLRCYRPLSGEHGPTLMPGQGKGSPGSLPGRVDLSPHKWRRARGAVAIPSGLAPDREGSLTLRSTVGNGCDGQTVPTKHAAL